MTLFEAFLRVFLRLKKVVFESQKELVLRLFLRLEKAWFTYIYIYIPKWSNPPARVKANLFSMGTGSAISLEQCWDAMNSGENRYKRGSINLFSLSKAKKSYFWDSQKRKTAILESQKQFFSKLCLRLKQL